MKETYFRENFHFQIWLQDKYTSLIDHSNIIIDFQEFSYQLTWEKDFNNRDTFDNAFQMCLEQMRAGELSTFFVSQESKESVESILMHFLEDQEMVR